VSELRFTWDARKAGTNRRKHGVSFEEAQSVFLDELAIVIDDPDVSREEERFLILGLSAGFRLLTVCHCVRGRGDEIRIISARRADRFEQQQYWMRLSR